MLRKVWNTAKKHIDLCAFALITGIAVIDLLRYAALGMLQPLLYMVVTELILVSFAFAAWKGKLPILMLPVGLAVGWLGTWTNYLETTLFHVGFFLQAGVAILWALGGIVLALRHIKQAAPHWWVFLALPLVLTAGCMVVCKVSYDAARMADRAGQTVWAVPQIYEQECEHPGIVEHISYETKAYATDERTVEKQACVYLPYGYDPEKQYNILYLMHGTGDNEDYWLLTHPENKTMLDQMIEQQVIEPLIVVTPTFYVEDDCKDGLDPLTYSFAKELRNDLMPAVEAQYSTYAETCDDAGFAASREHRAFAGLSRGAVTTNHSAVCQALDYFAWFGTFSGSRTTADEFRAAIQSDEFAQLPIKYLYACGGSYDFALPGQIEDYNNLLAVEPRLQSGVNTTFAVYPLRHHSADNWHIALYNFLQKVFVE